MGLIHAKNGGYVGVSYRRPYPSGVHVIGGVGRVSDIEVDVELYGGKGGGANYTSTEGGNGGYTKFRIKLSSARSLQVRPNYMAGGAGTYQGGAAAAGAGLLIAGEWLGVAGGGGGAGQRFTYEIATDQTSRYTNPGGAGSGGYGSGSPSAGTAGQSCGIYTDVPSPPFGWTGGSGSGGGGGGAAGGGNGGSGCYGSVWNPGPYGGGAGGSGNLRIYKDQSVTSGYLSVLPDVYMSYTTHSNGTHTGSPQVKLTNVATSASYTYTADSDIKLIYIKDGVFTP